MCSSDLVFLYGVGMKVGNADGAGLREIVRSSYLWRSSVWDNRLVGASMVGQVVAGIGEVE